MLICSNIENSATSTVLGGILPCVIATVSLHVFGTEILLALHITLS